MRLPITKSSSRPTPLELDEEHEAGDLVIDESIRGHLESSPNHTQSTPTYSSSTLTIAPTTPSPYSEGEGLLQRHSSPTASYAQLGHTFSRPSSSALSLLANSKRSGNGTSTSSRNGHPYLRRPSSDAEAKEDCYQSYPGNSGDTLVHCNGIWTPSSYPGPYEQQYSSSQHSQEQQQIVPVNIVRGGNCSTTSGVGYLYDMSNATGGGGSSSNSTCSDSSTNGYHHTHQQPLPTHQYKMEEDDSSSPTRLPVVATYGPPPTRNLGESSLGAEAHIKNAFFTQEQVDTLCDVILRDRKRNYEMLATIVSNLPKNIHDSENVLRARGALYYHAGDFNRLYDILGAYQYSVKHHQELQDLYRHARYAEAEKMRGKPLGAVDKYRIRRKYPLPPTIWDGESTSYTFKDRDRKLLIEAYLKCKGYPNAETKKELQLMTGLYKKQIDNWFKNRRQRDRPADQKPRKPNKNSCRDDDMMPSPDSPSYPCSTLPLQLPYQSPEDSMDMKYATYPSHTPTLAQVKSYNNLLIDMAQSPVPKKVGRRAGPKKEPLRKTGEKITKKKRGKAPASTTTQEHGDYPDPYNHTRGHKGHPEMEEDEPSPPPHPLHIGISCHQNAAQSHYHHPSVGVAGWGGWPASSSGGGSGSEQGYHPALNMNMLPSLAASFNYHHSHPINPEARILVQ